MNNNDDPLVSMSFSILSMLSNSVVFLKTMAARQTNIMILAEVAQMQFTYSMKSLATWKMYTKCETITHSNNKNPNTILLLNELKFVG